MRITRLLALAALTVLLCSLVACGPSYAPRRAETGIDDGVVGAPAWRLDNPPKAPAKKDAVSERELPPSGATR